MNLINQKKSVVILCNSYFGNFGGSFNVKKRAKLLKAEGFKVVIFHGMNLLPDKESIEEVSEIIHSKYLFNPFTVNPNKYFKLLFSRLFLLHYVLKNSPDFIFIHGERPNLFYLFLQIFTTVLFFRHDAIITCPVGCRAWYKSQILCSHKPGRVCLKVGVDEGCLEKGSLLFRTLKVIKCRYELWLLRFFTNFIANSSYIEAIHFSNAKIFFPPMQDEIIISNDDYKSKSTNTEKIKLMYVGRLETSKGPLDTLKVLKQLDDRYSLSIIGDGNMKSELLDFVNLNKLNNRVNFLGWLNRSRVNREMLEHDILLMPSIWDEAFGSVGIEAMSNGLTVVAYDSGGIKEWCVEPYGFLVKYRDVFSMAQTVIRVVSSERPKVAEFKEFVSLKFGEKAFKNELLDYLRLLLTKVH